VNPTLISFALALLAASAARTPRPDLGRILFEVAENQAKSQDPRTAFVYTQKVHVCMLRPGGKLTREERREYAVTPGTRSAARRLVHFEGRYAEHGTFVSYDKPGFERKSVDIDAGLIQGLAEEPFNDSNSRDGMDPGLFPLTWHRQQQYDFRLLATETYRGRQVYRIGFTPKRSQDWDAGWKGEALIDALDYQPVFIQTNMAWKMPRAVQVLLGTNIRGLGFSISYEKFRDGVWFPVSYGGEFDVRGLFLYRRTIAIALTNGDFRRAEVESHVAYAKDEK
jgi:hypothetical protein